MIQQVERATRWLKLCQRTLRLVLIAVLVGILGGCAPALPTFDDLPTSTGEPRASTQSGTTAPTAGETRTPERNLSSGDRDSTPESETVTIESSDDPRLVPRSTRTVPEPSDLIAELEQARRNWRNGELGAALLTYRRLAAQAPNSQEALVELAVVELATREFEEARETLLSALSLDPPEGMRARALYLLATVELKLGNWQEAMRLIEVPAAPDGLGDLVALRRAEAAATGGNVDAVRVELKRPEIRTSTNRIVLEQAGDLARLIGEPGLAGDLYARATDYPGWSVERTRLMQAAAETFADAGRTDDAIKQYRRLVELYSWTKLGKRAGIELNRLGGMTPYHRGRLAIIDGGLDAARGSLQEAAKGGEYAIPAQELLEQIEEILAWHKAADAGTPGAFQEFRAQIPSGDFLQDAWFQEGYIHYDDGRLSEALSVWRAALDHADGDDLARLHLWIGKTLGKLGQDAEAMSSLRTASQIGPAGYYSMRARDLVTGTVDWPVSKGGSTLPHPSSGVSPITDGERQKAEEWLATWVVSNSTPNVMTRPRVRRGLGFLALGLTAEANAELNGLIKETTDGRFLFQLAQVLAEREVWGSSSRAAWRIVDLSPAESVTDTPVAIQRLAYPLAFPDLLAFEAERHDLDPLLFLTLIHQESLYDPFALSISEARGLTQVIPTTGDLIANAIDWPDFSPDDLYRPVVAFEFGAWFLANQLKTFDDDPFRALAAYNAGGGSISRWWTGDVDLFIEQIDYAETRKYMRKLYFHHAVYRSLAGR